MEAMDNAKVKMDKVIQFAQGEQMPPCLIKFRRIITERLRH
jgi:hypothetical protein